MPWSLKRTTQCAKCPWRVGVNPHDIPNGYEVEKHKALASTIAKPGDLCGLRGGELRAMACHETEDAHCIGWLSHQLGPGNNIGLRVHVRDCANIGQLRTIGPQHESFAETLPDAAS